MENKTSIVHSEPVREILGTPPRKLVAWGTTLMFILFVFIILAAWYIRYPDVVPAQIEITSRIPPATLAAQASGRLVSIECSDNQTVKKGDVLAVIGSSANHSLLLSLEKLLVRAGNTVILNPDSLAQFTNLGEVQEPFNLYLRSLLRYRNYVSNDYIGNRIRALENETDAGKKYIASLRDKEKLLGEDLSIQHSAFRRDSSLLNSGALTRAAFERSQQEFLARRIGFQQIGIDILAETIALSRKEQEIQDLQIKRNEDLQSLSDEIAANLSGLRSEIDAWKTDYILGAPFDGRVVFTRLLGPQQYVTQNEQLMTVVPEFSGEPVGRIILPMQRSGKVVVGMEVIIKLSGYPYLEYGTIKGIVSSLSPVAEGEGFLAEISLPGGLVTNYGREMKLSQNMSGIAEIITEDLNLLQKVIDPIRFLIVRSREK